jgi:hypothetical protein
MRFSEEPSRTRFATMVVHSFIFTPKILGLAEVIAGRMRELNGGRLWMGAHMRRGDCEYISSPPLTKAKLITDPELLPSQQSSDSVGRWNPPQRPTYSA